LAIFSAPAGGQADESKLAEFMSAINDDLNTAKGLAVLHDTLNSDLPSDIKRATVEQFDTILGILAEQSITPTQDIPEDILSLAQDREVARERADWAQADLIRSEIEKRGYTVNDTPEGPEVAPLV
ncbi:MAG: cysteinyl-tRNA synthetase, partial [Patescibacteria group bacterium]|nr:cysteinyl-tRNA synthetase [Patescibacteria group bacterium]